MHLYLCSLIYELEDLLHNDNCDYFMVMGYEDFFHFFTCLDLQDFYLEHPEAL